MTIHRHKNDKKRCPCSKLPCSTFAVWTHIHNLLAERFFFSFLIDFLENIDINGSFFRLVSTIFQIICTVLFFCPPLCNSAVNWTEFRFEFSIVKTQIFLKKMATQHNGLINAQSLSHKNTHTQTQKIRWKKRYARRNLIDSCLNWSWPFSRRQFFLLQFAVGIFAKSMFRVHNRLYLYN